MIKYGCWKCYISSNCEHGRTYPKVTSCGNGCKKTMARCHWAWLFETLAGAFVCFKQNGVIFLAYLQWWRRFRVRVISKASSLVVLAPGVEHTACVKASALRALCTQWWQISLETTERGGRRAEGEKRIKRKHGGKEGLIDSALRGWKEKI